MLKINTILHTKDGARIGNAIITGIEDNYYEITTDLGNKVKFTEHEIDKHFNIAWSHFTKEKHGYSCEEIQDIMSSQHKYKV
jgi:hypothetical protein